MIDLENCTLEEAKAWLRKNWESGTFCPCCHQNVRLWKRKINRGMARALIALYRWERSQPDENWCHVHQHLLSTGHYDGDFPKLRHWGLIARKTDVGDDGNPRVGFYRTTPNGRLFVEEKIATQKYVYLYNDTVQRRANPDRTTATIRECLGDKFNYEELMKATPDGSTTPI